MEFKIFPTDSPTTHSFNPERLNTITPNKGLLCSAALDQTVEGLRNSNDMVIGLTLRELTGRKPDVPFVTDLCRLTLETRSIAILKRRT